MLHPHPACRIPALPLQSASVLTEEGAMRAERSILYNRPLLLLHHYVGSHDGSNKAITRAELAGLRKTAKRIALLVNRLCDPASFQPLEWGEPEHLIFATSAPATDCNRLQEHLIQAEELQPLLLNGSMVLEFWRC